MSIEFSGSTQRFYVTTGTVISQELFTVCGQFKLTSNTSCVLLTIYSSAGNLHELYYNSATGELSIRENFSSHVAVIGTVAINEWFFAGMKGEDPGTLKMRLHGFFKRPGGGFNTAYVDSDQFADSMNLIYLGADANNSSLWLRGRAADVHLAGAFWSDSDLTTQAGQQAAVVSTGLIGSNYLDGGSLAAAKSSNVSNQSYFDNWTTPGSPNDPAYSSDAPTYGPASVTLAGGWTMPSTVPSVGIDVLQSVIATRESDTYVEATLESAPTPGNMLLVSVGGFIGASGNAVTITDNQRAGSPLPANAYQQKVFAQAGTTGIWDGWWMLPVPADAVAPFTVRATPSGSPSWLSIAVIEVKQVDTVTPVLGTPASATGSSAAPAVSTGSIGSQPALVLGSASFLSSSNVATPGTNYTTVRNKDGAAGLHVLKRRITATGTYTPTWALTGSDSWVATTIVLKEGSTSAVTPTVTTTTLPDGTAGQSYASVTLAATGTGPFTWSIPTGSLPAGLVLDSALGVIGGVLASNATTQTFTVRATGPTGLYDDQSLTLTVGSAPVVATLALPTATVGLAYLATLSITGATASAIVGLPSPLSYSNSTKQITGTPAAAGGYPVTLTATNAYGTTTVNYVLTIQSAAATVTGSPWTQFLKAR